jgi:2-methylisocitrate lyase-like PEP mutase family enzyme
MSTQSILATTLRRLHIPGRPIILTNVYDAASARVIAGLKGTQALATASYAVAAAAGFADKDLTLEANLSAVRAITTVAKEYSLPLTVDWQDGYGSQLEEGLEKLLDLGVVGINLEDCNGETQKLYPTEEAVARVKKALAVAENRGVLDFVVNARTDVLLKGGLIDEAIARGKAYLAAGATTVFVLGGSRVITKSEVEQLTQAFNGRLNFGLRIGPGHFTVKELAEIGVARLSIGPQLQLIGMKAIADEAEKLLLSR